MRCGPEYLKNVDEYDKRVTDGWKEDAKGVLVFVSPHLLVRVSITMTISETGLFSATRIIHHRKLQVVVPRLW